MQSQPSFSPTGEPPGSQETAPAATPFGEAPAGAAPALPTMTPRKRLNSLTLFGDQREIEIEHSGQLYRLRLTSLGKLILTK